MNVLAPGPQGIDDDPPPGDPADCWYIFHTHDDERVCPECAPLDGAPINGADTNQHPPLHTNCRCWLTLDHCENDEPELPPEDPPGPGPF